MSSALRVFLLTYFRLVVDNIEDALSAAPAPGLGESPQEPIPGYLDIALQRFAVEQKQYALSEHGPGDTAH